MINPSLDKAPIYSHLGVREAWRHGGGRSTILGLMDEAGKDPRQVEAPESAFLPGATGDALTRLVADGLTLDRRVRRRRVRERTRSLG